MKNRKSSLLLAGLLLVSALGRAQDSLVTRCASTERDAIRLLKNPSLRNLRMRSEQAIQDYVRSEARARTSASEVITIPVVVHVIHSRTDNVIGGAGNSNISDAQIQSQIDVLNEDYGNTSGYKGFYTDSLGVDTGIRFRLVSVVRTYNATSQFSPITDADELAEISPAWFTNRYLNIWVTRLNDRYLGTSQFPVVTELNDRRPCYLRECRNRCLDGRGYYRFPVFWPQIGRDHKPDL